LLYYKKIVGWENLLRQRRLLTFRENIISYFENIEYDDVADSIDENEIAQEKRIEINRNLNAIQIVLASCGVSTSIYYSPPPAIGGLAGEICLFSNIFNLDGFEIPFQQIVDRIDRAIGIYAKDALWSWVRIFNPLFYVSLFLEYIASIPFILLGKAGFNQRAAEQSIIGKIVKFITELVALTASLLTILHLIGKLDVTLKFIKEFFP